MEEAVWVAAVVRLPAELEEAFIGMLAHRCTGVSSTATEDGRILLNVFLRSDEAVAAMEEARRFIAESGLDDEDCRLHAESVEDGHWVERFQASLRPFPVGERFKVYPSGRISGCSTRIPILLPPGRAFGTGQHPTTALCVGWIERTVESGGSWLDLGCGTAILAIVAHHCGAGEIVAIDNDPVAVEVAAAVLKSNGLLERIALECRSLRDGEERRRDGVVVNISSTFVVLQAQRLAAMLAPGGILICSGFLAEDSADVRTALAGRGLRIVGSETRAEWAVLVAMKPDASSR